MTFCVLPAIIDGELLGVAFRISCKSGVDTSDSKPLSLFTESKISPIMIGALSEPSISNEAIIVISCALPNPPYTGKLSCFRPGISTCLLRSIESARGIGDPSITASCLPPSDKNQRVAWQGARSTNPPFSTHPLCSHSMPHQQRRAPQNRVCGSRRFDLGR